MWTTRPVTVIVVIALIGDLAAVHGGLFDFFRGEQCPVQGFISFLMYEKPSMNDERMNKVSLIGFNGQWMTSKPAHNDNLMGTIFVIHACIFAGWRIFWIVVYKWLQGSFYSTITNTQCDRVLVIHNKLIHTTAVWIESTKRSGNSTRFSFSIIWIRSFVDADGQSDVVFVYYC